MHNWSAAMALVWWCGRLQECGEPRVEMRLEERLAEAQKETEKESRAQLYLLNSERVAKLQG